MLVINNNQAGLKSIVFDSKFKVRPVAKLDDNEGTVQCIADGDIVIYKLRDSNDIEAMVSDTVTRNPDKSVYVRHVNSDLYAFLTNDDNKLPAGYGWDGENTLNSLVFKYGLDKFLTGVPDYAILGGVMGLTYDLSTAQLGNFDIDVVLPRSPIEIDNAASAAQRDSLLKSIDSNYKDWMIERGLVIPEHSINWNKAKQLPDTLSVSAILKDGKPVRYNDLVVWRGNDVEPEVISVFDISITFNMTNTNFITLPYAIDDEVTRIMYVLHGDNLTTTGDSTIWLYRNR